MDRKFTTTFTHNLGYNVVTTTLQVIKRDLYCYWVLWLNLRPSLIKPFTKILRKLPKWTLTILILSNSHSMFGQRFGRITCKEPSTFMPFKKVVKIILMTKVSHITIDLVRLMGMELNLAATKGSQQPNWRKILRHMLNKISQTKTNLLIDLVELCLWVSASRNGNQLLILDSNLHHHWLMQLLHMPGRNYKLFIINTASWYSSHLSLTPKHSKEFFKINIHWHI